MKIMVSFIVAFGSTNHSIKQVNDFPCHSLCINPCFMLDFPLHNRRVCAHVVGIFGHINTNFLCFINHPVFYLLLFFLYSLGSLIYYFFLNLTQIILSISNRRGVIAAFRYTLFYNFVLFFFVVIFYCYLLKMLLPC